MNAEEDEMFKEWMSVLQSLWVAFDKPVVPELVREYFNAFCELPLALLEIVVSKAKKKCQYFPRISELDRLVDEELQGVAWAGKRQDQVSEWCIRQYPIWTETSKRS